MHAERKQRWLRSGVLSKMAEELGENNCWINYVIIVFFVHKSILVAS